MLLKQSLADVSLFVQSLDEFTSETDPNPLRLSRIQKSFLAFVLSAMVIIGHLCWKHFERASLGGRGAKALSFLFCHSKIPWNRLLHKSIERMIHLAGAQGYFIIDDTDRLRARGTTKLHKTHRIKNKKTNGYGQAQNIVFAVLVTKKLTIPIGFGFYMPDPALTKWTQEDKRLRKQGVPKKERPEKPKRSDEFPTRSAIAVGLIREFMKHHPHFKIESVIADCAYLNNEFIDGVEKVLPNSPIISELPKHYKIQSVVNQNEKAKRVSDYFDGREFHGCSLRLRAGEERSFRVSRSEIVVPCRGNRQMTAVCMHLEGQPEPKVIVCTKRGYRSEKIIMAYGQRWFVEVVIQDWKEYDGWGKWALQRGDEGARSGVILSLVADHLLLSHPLQVKRLETGNQVFTAGSMRRYLRNSAVFCEVKTLLEHPNPRSALRQLADSLITVADLLPSDKHMTGSNSFEFVPELVMRRRRPP